MENFLESLDSLTEAWQSYGLASYNSDPKFTLLSGVGLFLLYACYLILKTFLLLLWKRKGTRKVRRLFICVSHFCLKLRNEFGCLRGMLEMGPWEKDHHHYPGHKAWQERWEDYGFHLKPTVSKGSRIKCQAPIPLGWFQFSGSLHVTSISWHSISVLYSQIMCPFTKASSMLSWSGEQGWLLKASQWSLDHDLRPSHRVLGGGTAVTTGFRVFAIK